MVVLVVLILLHLFDWKDVKSTFLMHLRTSNSIEKLLSKHPPKLINMKSATFTATYPWETSASAIRTRILQVFPRVHLQVPTGHLHSCHALQCYMLF